jgi:hypothetical protein
VFPSAVALSQQRLGGVYQQDPSHDSCRMTSWPPTMCMPLPLKLTQNMSGPALTPITATYSMHPKATPEPSRKRSSKLTFSVQLSPQFSQKLPAVPSSMR